MAESITLKSKGKLVKDLKITRVRRTVGITKSISTKILLVATLVIIISLTICIRIAKSFAENRLTQAQVSGISAVAEEKSIALERFITDQSIIVKMISSNAAILDQAKIYSLTGDMFPAKQNTISSYLAEVNESNGNIYENLFVTYSSLMYADCWGNTTLRDTKDELFYSGVMNNGFYMGSEISAQSGKPVFVIAYPIFDANGVDILGTVNLTIDMTALSKEIVKSDAYAITVLDPEGYIVATNSAVDNILTNIRDMDVDNFNNMLSTKKGNLVVDLSSFGGTVTYLSYVVSEHFIMETSVDEAVVVGPIKEMSRNLTFVSLFMGVISIAFITMVLLLIIKPLKIATNNVEEVIDEISTGTGDLTKKIPVKHEDEIGFLVSGINNLMQTMANLISNVQVITTQVSDSSGEIDIKIENAELEISNVSATMEQMSASSEETSASLTQVMSEVDSVVDLVAGVNDESTKNVKYADSVVTKVNDIRDKSIREREEATKHLNEVAVNLRNKIDNAKQVQEIANLTTEILSITSKTNLLSLNASIEAARAGEAGRGFAVVADEIRQLADSSKEAANRIQEVTSNVILAVEELASEAENVTDFMIKNNEENLEESNVLTENYSADIKKLSEAMESFKVSSDDIRSAMDIIKEAIDAVNIAADETAQGITNVAQSTVELSNELQAVLGMANDNLNESTKLADTMNKFTV